MAVLLTLMAAATVSAPGQASHAQVVSAGNETYKTALL